MILDWVYLRRMVIVVRSMLMQLVTHVQKLYASFSYKRQKMLNVFIRRFCTRKPIAMVRESLLYYLISDFVIKFLSFEFLGYKTEGITYPSGTMQQKLLSEFYNEVQIDPSTLAYLEAHSTGTIVGDPEECQAIDNIFCKNRTKPLPVGSVKSNIGHSESTAGVCSVTKALLAFETGLIAPNINFKRIRPGIKSLEEGRLSVCTDVTKLEGNLIGLNAFGFGGANAHVLLRRNLKEKKNHGIPDDDLPRLVNWSGRTEESINIAFEKLQSQPLDAEYIGLMHNVQNGETPGYLFRGYGLFRKSSDGGNAELIGKEIHHYNGLKRPVVWVFSGMGSQWCEMGLQLLEIPVFRASIENCHRILKPYGVDLIRIITASDKNMFDNILHSFVGIAAIQIGLVDMLRLLNVPADHFIGGFCRFAIAFQIEFSQMTDCVLF